MKTVWELRKNDSSVFYEDFDVADSHRSILGIDGIAPELIKHPLVPSTRAEGVDEKQDGQIEKLLRLSDRNRTVDIIQWVGIGLALGLYVFGHFIGAGCGK